MYRYILYLILIVCSCNVCVATTTEPLEVNILQWNIHAAVDIHGKPNLQRQAEVMREAKPDIVVLNEVEKNCARSNYIDMPKELGRALGMQSVFAAGRVYPPEGMLGNAVLSRYPMELIGAWLMPNSPYEPRGAVMLVKMNAPHPFYIVATHLPASQENEQERVKILARMVKMIQSQAISYPTIIVGDLNCEAESDCIRALAKMKWHAGMVLPTMPVRNPKRARDYIVYRPDDKRIELIDRYIIDERTASDHLPVLNKIKVYPQSRP